MKEKKNFMMFINKKIESSGAGKIIRETRKAHKLSLQECSKKLKINAKYLEWLESERYEKLPADVYTKNFLKRYAIFLNLDPDKLLPYYRRDRAIEKKINIQKKSSFKRPRLILTPKKISSLLFFIFFILIIFYLFFQLKNFFIGPKIILDYPKKDLITTSEKIEISGRTNPANYLTINGESVNLSKDGFFAQEIILGSKLNTITVEASNRFGKKSTLIRQIIKQAEGAPLYE